MNAQDYKKAVLRLSDEELVNEYFGLLDELAYDFVSFDWDKEAYDQYWQHDRSEYQAQLKIVEVELSYRHINL